MMLIKSPHELGQLIRLARIERGWSQAKLALMLDTSQRWVSEIENGKSRAEVGRVLRCLRELGVTLDGQISGAPTAAPAPSGPSLRDLLARSRHDNKRKDDSE